MAKTKVSQFDATASNNTDINSVNVAEGCPPSGINNAIREMASLLKKQEVGTDAMTSPDIDGGTIDGATIGASSASTGAFTTISASGNVDLNGDLDVDGAITSSAGMTITTADNLDTLTLKSTDADENSGPRFALTRDSSSPAVNDFMGLISFNGEDSGSNVTRYAYAVAQATNVTDGSEEGKFVIHTMVLERDLEVKGDVASIELPTGSEKGVNAYFCIICGVYIFCRYGISKGRIAVRTQTLENPIQPQAHIFVKDKDPWIEITDNTICHNKMYDREKTWPKESLDRIT